MNIEQVKGKVRDLLKEIYFAIEGDLELRNHTDFDYDDALVLLMIAAQALRLKEEKDIGSDKE